jgi:hypothetical protein
MYSRFLLIDTYLRSKLSTRSLHQSAQKPDTLMQCKALARPSFACICVGKRRVWRCAFLCGWRISSIYCSPTFPGEGSETILLLRYEFFGLILPSYLAGHENQHTNGISSGAVEMQHFPQHTAPHSRTQHSSTLQHSKRKCSQKEQTIVGCEWFRTCPKVSPFPSSHRSFAAYTFI